MRMVHKLQYIKMNEQIKQQYMHSNLKINHLSESGDDLCMPNLC